jgi:rhomboid family GlyGly-CTERM serine protease
MQLKIIHILEWLLFGTLLLAANAGLFSGTPKADWLLVPSAVAQGQWWRLLLHPWVHVSAYHLLLDASAFLCLFFMLDRTRLGERWFILAAAWAGQLLAVWWGEPRLEALGLCGLSGTAHGLFAAVCVQWCRQPERRTAGTVLLLGLIAKSIWEALAGQAFLASWHIGPVGNPLTLCHAGGVLAGFAAGLSCNFKLFFKNRFKRCILLIGNGLYICLGALTGINRVFPGNTIRQQPHR